MKKEQTTLRIPNSLIAEIKRISVASEKTVSEIIREAIRSLVNRYEFMDTELIGKAR